MKNKTLVYGRYTQAQWNKLHYDEQIRVMDDYRMKQWRAGWIAQHKWEASMGIPGNQLQPYRA